MQSSFYQQTQTMSTKKAQKLHIIEAENLPTWQNHKSFLRIVPARSDTFIGAAEDLEKISLIHLCSKALLKRMKKSDGFRFSSSRRSSLINRTHKVAWKCRQIAIRKNVSQLILLRDSIKPSMFLERGQKYEKPQHDFLFMLLVLLKQGDLCSFLTELFIKGFYNWKACVLRNYWIHQRAWRGVYYRVSKK